MGTKETRRKFGFAGGPLQGTKVLRKDLDPAHFSGKVSFSLIVLNEVAGTFTAANCYGGNLGKNYDPQYYTHPIPAEGSDKRKKWGHDYRELTPEDAGKLDVVELISPTPAPKAPKAPAKK